MSSPRTTRTLKSTLREFLDSETASGFILMAVAVLAIAVANSPLAPAYFKTLHAELGPLSVQHWINDALMALFFLLVGLEIKREVLEGQLSTWQDRRLPGVAALGGMLVPAVIYAGFNIATPETLHGWAIPAATDIAFALGVLAILGSRVPVGLKVFLTALAIIDDLGAVVVIALFYTSHINLWALGGAAIVFLALLGLGRLRIAALVPYLALGLILWGLVWLSGIHSTVAGVLLALTIPLKAKAGKTAPLLKLEHLLHRPVSFVIIPLFGFANAGISFAGVTLATAADTITLGAALGLLIGKLVGVFGAVTLMVKSRAAQLPAGSTWHQMFGLSLLCGIGFTMSLFVGMLAFHDAAMQDRAKLGILAGSVLAGTLGYLVLRLSKPHRARPDPVGH